MNHKRIVLGGLAGGLVMAVLDGVANGLVFGPQWNAAYAKLGLPTMSVGVPIFWTVFDLLAGVLIAWLAAAMRPRFGSATRAAVYAALVEWLVLHATLASHAVDGVFPAGLLATLAVPELISALVGGLIAARMYRELDPVPRATGALAGA
jgi:hypothetical protein